MSGGVSPNGIKPDRELESPRARWLTLCVILVLHVLIIGGTIFWGGGCSTDKPREKQYKVKLTPPEAAPQPRPEVAPTPTPPQPPEPVVTPPPKPQPPEPVVTPPPRPQPKEPTVRRTPRRPQPTEPTVRRTPRRPQPTEPTVRRTPRRQQPTEPTVRRQPRRPQKGTPRDSGVYQPTNVPKFNPKGTYNSSPTNRGRNPNARSSNRPGPGDDPEKNQKWYDKVSGDVYNCWTPPEGVFWQGSPPQATVELLVAADGRVKHARLVKSSGNPRMDASIRQMFGVLTRVTPPPGGEQSIRLELIPE